MRVCCLRLSWPNSGGLRHPIAADAQLLYHQANMQESLPLGRTSRPYVHSSVMRSRTPQYCSKREPSRRAAAQICKERLLQCCAQAQSTDCITAESEVEPEANTQGMSAWLDGLKWDAGGLVAVIAQVSLKLPLA